MPRPGFKLTSQSCTSLNRDAVEENPIFLPVVWIRAVDLAVLAEGEPRLSGSAAGRWCLPGPRAAVGRTSWPTSG